MLLIGRQLPRLHSTSLAQCFMLLSKLAILESFHRDTAIYITIKLIASLV